MKHFELSLGTEPKKKKKKIKWLCFHFISFSLDGVMYVTSYFNDITK